MNNLTSNEERGIMNQDTINNGDMSKRKQGRRSNGCGGLKLHGNTWYARYTDALGIRREVSTHTSNRDEALRILAGYTAPIRESKSHAEIKLRLQQSIDVLELQRDVAKMERLEISNLADKLINHRNLTDATSGTKKNYIKHLRALNEAIAKVRPTARYIDDVTMGVADLAMGELARRFTPSTYNLALATYRRCWGMFSPRNNPFTHISKRKIDKSRHRMCVSEDDVRRIFDACRDDEERAVWGVGVYTGLRCGDVCNLTYGALDKDLTTLTCMPQKTKRHMVEPLEIPICPPLKDLLMKVLKWHKIGNEEYKDEPLWSDYKRRYGTSNFTEWFRRTLKKAGLQTSHKDKDGHLAVDTGFHITRHAFVTFASRYMSPFLVQRIVGQSDITMTEHYFHTREDDMRNGLNQMPDFAADEQERVKVKSEGDEIMDMLDSMKQDGESRIECLRRLICGSSRAAG